MKNERDLFEGVMKSKCIFDLDYVQYHDVSNKYVIQGGLSGDDFKIALDASHVVNTAWLVWQAATQREGFRFVPVNPDNEVISSLASVICDEFDTTIDGSAHCAKEAYKAMIGAIDE